MTTRRERTRVGTGITERIVEQVKIDEPAGLADMKATRQLLRTAATIKIRGEHGETVSLLLRHSFEADAAIIEQRARSILERSGQEPSTEDSPAGYAARALKFVDHVRQFIAKNDASAAAHYALKLGALLMQEEMKFAHEPAALTGMKQRSALADNRLRTNQTRHEMRAAEWARWQAAADAVWKRHPECTKNAVARVVRVELRLTDTVGVIAARLKKPREAG